MAAATSEDVSDSSTSTIKGPGLKKRRHRQQKNQSLNCANLSKQAETGKTFHATKLSDAYDALHVSLLDALHSSKTGDVVQPTVAQHSVKDDECNSDTSASSEETLKAKRGNSKGSFFHGFARRSHKAQCAPQLQIWAHESHSANLTLAEILEKVNWEAARLEKL